MTRAGLAVALAGALWAWQVGTNCPACHEARLALGGLPLDLTGVVFYGVLSLLAWSAKTKPSVRVGTSAASGVHLVLLSLFLKQRVFCFPCSLSAFGAFLAAGGCSARNDFAFRRHGWPLPVAALVALLALVATQRAAIAGWRSQAERLLAEAVRGSQTNAGVRLLVFERPGCRHCERFRVELLPQITNTFGNRLAVEYQLAPTQLPSPTVFVVGLTNGTFLGVPSWPALSNAIERASGVEFRLH